MTDTPDIVHETDDIYRLYRDEWVIVHTVSGHGDDSRPFFDQTLNHFETTYEGRIAERHAQIEGNTDNAGAFWFHLKIFRPNLKGEFKHAFLAQRHAEKQAWADYEVVARNSKRDHEIRSYGLTKLS